MREHERQYPHGGAATMDPAPSVPLPVSASTDAESWTMTEAVRTWAQLYPDKPALRFVREDGSEDEISYQALDMWARSIAENLRSSLMPGTRVLLLFPAGLDFAAAFLGCLYARMVAVPICPPKFHRPSQQLTGVIENCEPRMVLSVANYCERRNNIFHQIPALVDLPWMSTESRRGRSAREVVITADRSALVLLQYTSGSTGNQKGVMVTHDCLAANSALIQSAFGTNLETRGVFWLPHYHDMGLIGGILGTLYAGAFSVLMAPLTIIRRPLAWLEQISKTRATISGGPDFSYDLCVRRVTPAERAHLNLGEWELAFSGAEPVRLETIERFSTAFSVAGFKRSAFAPCYGLAEATLLVTAGGAGPLVVDVDADALERGLISPSCADQRSRALVACGHELPGQQVCIVDPLTHKALAEDEVGEIWVRGRSVAQGYWAQPQVSEFTFGAHLTKACDPLQQSYMRTGDLGFRRSGRLFVTGRLKDLIIVRGRNLYPQDIELTVQRSSARLEHATCAVFSLELEGQEKLVVVVELEQRHTYDGELDGMVAALRQAVGSEHDVDVHAVVVLRAGGIPRTSSGKLRRHACRDAWLKGEWKPLGSWVQSDGHAAISDIDPSEGQLVNAPVTRTAEEIAAWMVARVASFISVPAASIGVHTPFASLGLSSMQGVLLIEELQVYVNTKISATWIYNYPSIDELSRRLTSSFPASTTTPSRSRDSSTDLYVDATDENDVGLRDQVNDLSSAELEEFISTQMSDSS